MRQIWQKAFARIARPYKPRLQASPGSPDLARMVADVARENQVLSGELHRILSASEQARSEETLRIAILEAASQEAQTVRTGEAKLLADLERRLIVLETERNHTLGLIKSIGTSLGDASNRVDAMDNQIRLLQANNEEQSKEFKASLSLAIARQDTTDGELKALRDVSHQHIKVIESSLADASTRLETTNFQVRTLEKKLDLEHQLYLHTVQEVQSQVRNQDQRLNWTMMAAVFAMLLGTVAGGILIWDVQKNARVLSGISKDMELIGSSLAQSRMMRHPDGADGTASLPAAVHADRHDDPEGHRAAGEESPSGP